MATGSYRRPSGSAAYRAGYTYTGRGIPEPDLPGVQEILRMGDEVVRGQQRLRNLAIRPSTANIQDLLTTMVQHSLPALQAARFNQQKIHLEMELADATSIITCHKPCTAIKLLQTKKLADPERIRPIEEINMDLQVSMENTINTTFGYSVIHLGFTVWSFINTMSELRQTKLKSDQFTKDLDSIESEVAMVGEESFQMVTKYIQGFPQEVTFSGIQIKFERILGKLEMVVFSITSEIGQVQEKEKGHKMSMVGRLVDLGVTVAQTGLMWTTPGYVQLHWGYKAAQYASVVMYGVSAGLDAVAMVKCQETLKMLQKNLEKGREVNDKWNEQYGKFIHAVRSLTEPGNGSQTQIISRSLQPRYNSLVQRR